MRQEPPHPLRRHRGRAPSSRNSSSTLDSADASAGVPPADTERGAAAATAVASGGSSDGEVAQAVVMPPPPPPPPQSFDPAAVQLTRLSSMDSVSLTDEGAVARRRPHSFMAPPFTSCFPSRCDCGPWGIDSCRLTSNSHLRTKPQPVFHCGLC